MLSLALLAIFLALWFLPDVVDRLGRAQDEAWLRVRSTGVMRFATEASYHPFGGVGSDGVFYGLDIDVAREVARRIGARADFAGVGIDALYDVLRVGQADASISALPIDPARLGRWAYSRPYFDGGLVLVAPGNSDLGGEADLTAHTIAVERGSDGDARLRYYQRRIMGIASLALSSAEEALRAVERAEADAAILDSLTARRLMATQYGDLRIVAQLTHAPYAIAVWAEGGLLLEAVDRALDDMQADGTLDRLVRAWLTK